MSTRHSKTVELKTNLGSITIDLDQKKAPATTENFLQYVEDGFYSGTIFHRIINNFMIQGGGFTSDMRQKPTRDPITNEADNGLKNEKGTIAMARTSDPNSATAQFFINHIDNDFLDYTGPANPGYAVFGKVTDGMDIVEAIASVDTDGSDAPEQTVTIDSVIVIGSDESQ